MRTAGTVTTWGRRRMTRLGILPGGEEHSAGAATEGGPSWFRLCIGGWGAMLGALMASAPLIAEPGYILTVGIALIAAFPVAYRLHFSQVSRRGVTGVVFAAAVILGAAEILAHWPPGGLRALQYMGFAVLVKFFLWVLAFRAFTIRTQSDLVLSIIPSVSCVLLVLVAPPSPLAVLGTSVLAVSALYLLAAEHSAATRSGGDRIRRVREVAWDRGPRRGASVNTWQAISAIVLIAALIAGVGASYFQFSSELGRGFRETLARHIAGYLIAERYDYSPEAVVPLTGQTPPEGNRILFVVDCDRGENWRQQVYAVYTGYSWGQLLAPRRKARQERGAWVIEPDVVSGFRATGASEVKQTFHLKAPFSAALPGLLLAVRVRAPVFSIHMGEAAVLNCSGYVGSGQSYEVTSLVPVPGPTPRSDALPPLDDDIKEQYLQLPDGLPERIGALARAVTVEARDSHDAAFSIERFLVETYPYSLDPPLRPRGRDFVDHFLFDARTGYCNHFASAMAVMCRSVGIPARLVTGYVAGEYDSDADSYEVRAKDAHSWVEVYVEGRGWQPFEPTPPLAEEDRAPIAALWERAAGVAGVAWRFVEGRAWQLGGLAGALSCLGCAAVLGKRRRFGRTRLQRRGASPDGRAVFAYRQMLRWFSRFGLRRGEAQPPLEYVASLPVAADALIPDVRRITLQYMRARYGRRGIAEADAAQVEEALARLRGALFRDRALS